MAYSRKLLNPDEQVHLDLHPHWVVFAKPAVLVILLAIADIRAQEIANASLKIGVDRVLLVALAAALG